MGDYYFKKNEKEFQNNGKTRAKVIIIGRGFGGLAAAIRLKEEGENDYIILERDDDSRWCVA